MLPLFLLLGRSEAARGGEREEERYTTHISCSSRSRPVGSLCPSYQKLQVQEKRGAAGGGGLHAQLAVLLRRTSTPIRQHGLCDEASFRWSHQRHGQDAGGGGGERPRCIQERGGAAGGAEAAGGGEEGQARPHGGREGESTAEHQGQVRAEEEGGEGGRGEGGHGAGLRGILDSS